MIFAKSFRQIAPGFAAQDAAVASQCRSYPSKAADNTRYRGALQQFRCRRGLGLDARTMAGLVTMDSCPINNTLALDQPPQTAPSRRSLSVHGRLYRSAASAACPRTHENSPDSPSAR